MESDILSSDNWDFDKVPDHELVACCYWEYARESAFIRGLRQRCVQNWRSGGCRDQKLYEDLQRAQSIGYSSEVFISGFFFDPDISYQSEDKKLANYRHPDAPAITGSFPQPWQSLSMDERIDRSHIKDDINTLGLVPFQISRWCFAKDVARYVESQAQRMREEPTRYPGLKPIRPGLGISNAETLLVDIAWDFFTDDQIVNYFRQWVKQARPKDRRAPSGRGHKPGDWRANLTRLAAMRLLARFTSKEILGTKRILPLAACQPIHNTKQFTSDKWGDPSKWRDARREAGRLFLKLFPFLPPDEKPLSWNRQTPAK